MSFVTIATLLPVAIQAIDALDDLVINAMKALGDDGEGTIEEMIAAKQASAARRNAALDRLRAKIEEMPDG